MNTDSKVCNICGNVTSQQKFWCDNHLAERRKAIENAVRAIKNPTKPA